MWLSGGVWGCKPSPETHHPRDNLCFAGGLSNCAWLADPLTRGGVRGCRFRRLQEEGDVRKGHPPASPSSRGLSLAPEPSPRSSWEEGPGWGKQVPLLCPNTPRGSMTVRTSVCTLGSVTACLCAFTCATSFNSPPLSQGWGVTFLLGKLSHSTCLSRSTQTEAG